MPKQLRLDLRRRAGLWLTRNYLGLSSITVLVTNLVIMFIAFTSMADPRVRAALSTPAIDIFVFFVIDAALFFLLSTAAFSVGKAMYVADQQL